MNTSLNVAKIDAAEMEGLLGASQPAEFVERRADARHPFFAPVSIRSLDAPTKLLSAFSREISCSGIGLLHNMAIEQGMVANVSVTIGETKVSKIAEAVWCRAAGEGWYLSGWRFVSAG